jgi:hypothetical protein
MKKLLSLVAASVLVGTLGCKERELVAEPPPAVTKAPEPVRLAPPVSRVDPEEINEENWKDLAGQLQKDLNSDQRATARTGRDTVDRK